MDGFLFDTKLLNHWEKVNKKIMIVLVNIIDKILFLINKIGHEGVFFMP
jgi:hypothetical protein